MKIRVHLEKMLTNDFSCIFEDCVGTPTPFFFDNADYINGNNDNEATNVSNGM